MLFVGFTGSYYNQEMEKSIHPGEKLEIAGYTLTYYGYEHTKPKSTLDELVATLLVEKDGKKMGYVLPERNVHYLKDVSGKMNPQPTSEVAIHTTYVEDLYVIFAALNQDESATFKVHINPLVKWLWLGGVVLGLGALLAVWPDKIERKRFEARHMSHEQAQEG